MPISALYKAWQDKSLRRRWLPNAAITIRKATRNKSMRITWSEGKTGVDANFYPRGNGKSQVAVQHGKLPDAKAAARMKTYGAENLDRLKDIPEA